MRGFRIELGEIEAAAAGAAEVREAMVLASGRTWAVRLVVLRVARRRGRSSDADDLEAGLGGMLPEYMVPAARVVMARALPLNAERKGGSQRRCRSPSARQRQAYEAPRGETEEALAAVWAQVLGVERVGREDNFFELGGHSLLAIQLLERIRRQGWAIEVRTLFRSRAGADFARATEQSEASERREVDRSGQRYPGGLRSTIAPDMLPLVELEPAQLRRIEAHVPGGAANIQDIYPLAPLQEGILFHHLMQAEGDVYV